MADLSIITAFQQSRAHYLPTLIQSIEPCYEHFDRVYWITAIGPDDGGILTLGQKWNEAAKQLPPDCWTIFLDSDNVLHPDFAPKAAKAIAKADGERTRLLLGQQYNPDGTWRIESPQPRLGFVDNGNILAHSSLLQTIPFRHLNINLDGYWVQEVVVEHKNPYRVVGVPFYYNYQRR